METIEKEVKTQERILIYEDKERIEDFQNRVQDLCILLNRIDELIHVESPFHIPANPDEFIFDRVSLYRQDFRGKITCKETRTAIS